MKKQNKFPQFIVDTAGNKTGVILDIATFEQLIKTLESLSLGNKAHKILSGNLSKYHDFETLKKEWGK